MSEARGGSTNVTAILAFVAGIACFCFWGMGAVLAIGLGLLARAEIARSEPRQGGQGLATAAIALGTFNLCVWVVGLGVWFAWVARPSGGVVSSPPKAVAVAPKAPRASGASPPPRSADGAGKTTNTGPKRSASRARGTEVNWLGQVRLVDLGPPEAGRSVSLQSRLSEQLEQAKVARERVLLFAVAQDCLPCNGVALALRDARMQSALRGVRLVRIDVADFPEELSEVGVPVRRIPGFARLADGILPRAEDFIDGGEWDADVAANIAPVLGAFVRGRYRNRRHVSPEPQVPGQTLL